MIRKKFKNITLTLVVVVMTLLVVPLQVAAIGSINFSSSNISIDEAPASSNNNKDFILTLSPKPTATVNMSYSTNSQCTLSTGGASHTTGGQLVSQGFEFDFNVKAVNDSIEEGNHSCSLLFSITSSADSNYTSLSKSLTVNINDDNDKTFVPSISVVETLHGDLAEGTSNIYRYKLVLNQSPKDPVTITAFGGPQCQLLVPSQNGEKRVDTTDYTVQPGQTQTSSFTLIAREDDIFEGPHSCLISHSVTTNDLLFDNVSISPYIVAVGDNDLTFLQEQNDQLSADELADIIANETGLIDLLDGNNDSVLDSKQPHVQTFVNVVSGSRNALVIGGGCEIDGSVVSTPEKVSLATSELHFPLGLIEFTLKCPQKGTSATVKWLLGQQYPTNYPWLLRKVVDDNVNVITSAQFASFKVQKGDVTEISYVISDGGALDADGKEDGFIRDPVGLALAIGQIEETNQSILPQTSLGGAIFWSAILIVSTITVSWLLSRDIPRNWVQNRIIGKPSDKPRIDKF
jgi:hypothetical protein